PAERSRLSLHDALPIFDLLSPLRCPVVVVHAPDRSTQYPVSYDYKGIALIVTQRVYHENKEPNSPREFGFLQLMCLLREMYYSPTVVMRPSISGATGLFSAM